MRVPCLYTVGMDAVEQAVAMKNELLDMLNEVGEKLPPNTLDHLIDELGGTESVAEMTGRKGRVVNTDEGITYESRSEIDVPLEILNLTEKQRFMDGEKVWFCFNIFFSNLRIKLFKRYSTCLIFKFTWPISLRSLVNEVSANISQDNFMLKNIPVFTIIFILISKTYMHIIYMKSL